jgi:hypothetical protein
MTKPVVAKGGELMARFRWGVVLAMAGLALGAGSAIAQDDMTVAGGPKVVAETPAQAEQMARLEAIRANPEGTISELMARWAPPEGASQLETALRAAGPGKLYAVSRATSFKEVERILLGPAAGRPFNGAVTNTLGDTTQDFVYTPVSPCRIFDTRSGTGEFAGPITAGNSKQFYVYGSAGDIAPQGGSATGCPAPAGKGEPRGVHMNLTVVPVSGQGNARVYPADEAPPTSSSVNFKLGTNIANALTVKTYVSFGPKEIAVYVAVSDAHVVGDVLGYYYDASTPSFMASTSSTQTVPDNTETTVVFETEDHDTGADYNSTTGIFTVPETGLYDVGCHLVFSGIPAGTSRVNIYLKRNSGDLTVTWGTDVANETIMPRMVMGTWQLTAGDTIACNAFLQTTGASGSVTFPSYFFATRVR